MENKTNHAQTGSNAATDQNSMIDFISGLLNIPASTVDDHLKERAKEVTDMALSSETLQILVTDLIKTDYAFGINKTLNDLQNCAVQSDEYQQMDGEEMVNSIYNINAVRHFVEQIAKLEKILEDNMVIIIKPGETIVEDMLSAANVILRKSRFGQSAE